MGGAGLKLVQLYPKELNLYGDRGNTLCLIKRCKARGIRVDFTEVGIGESIPDFDILLIGGGQDKEMRLLQQDLRRKGEMLHYAVQSGKVIFGVCGGFQILGEYYELKSGERLKMSGALPLTTVGGEKRRIGNIVTESPFGSLVGFENHSGITRLGSLPSLGKVIRGFGNDGCGGEGVLYKNTFGTYLHGPVLPKNPALADALLCRALCADALPPLDDTAENRCHAQLLRRFSK